MSGLELAPQTFVRTNHPIAGVITAIILLGIADLSTSSCASATLIPVRGSAADRLSLAGEWFGTYTSPDLGRHGSIWFRLEGGAEAAHGDVRMTPRGSRLPYGRQPTPAVRPFEPEQFLAIRFVRISDAGVTGDLETYWDPDCACWANTTFQGQVNDGSMRGNFVTRLGNGLVAAGTWRVERRPAG